MTFHSTESHALKILNINAGLMKKQAENLSRAYVNRTQVPLVTKADIKVLHWLKKIWNVLLSKRQLVAPSEIEQSCYIIYHYQKGWFHRRTETNPTLNENFSISKRKFLFKKGRLIAFSKTNVWDIFFQCAG